VVYNWCDAAQVCPSQKNDELAKSLKMAGRFNVVFAGNMGKAQALESVLDAAKIVADQKSEIQFVFIGSGVCVDGLKQKAADMGLTNVLFLSRLPVSEIGGILNLADVLFVHLKKDPLFEITIPSKIQSYLAAGRPVLIGVPGDAASLVRQANAGLSCEPENSDSIAETVLTLYAMPKDDRERMGETESNFMKNIFRLELRTLELKKYLH
jgi:colanic acid biosynthesis glycosyl transferase WcaI